MKIVGDRLVGEGGRRRSGRMKLNGMSGDVWKRRTGRGPNEEEVRRSQ